MTQEKLFLLPSSIPLDPNDKVKILSTFSSQKIACIFSCIHKKVYCYIIDQLKNTIAIKDEDIPFELKDIKDVTSFSQLLGNKYAIISEGLSGSVKLYLGEKDKYRTEESFTILLNNIKNLVLGRSSIQIKAFISYAWEDLRDDKGAKINDKMQRWLGELRDNLQEIGISVFLDIGDMHGDMSNRMKEYLEQSDVILTINTVRFKTRALDPKTNLGFEYGLTLQKAKTGALVIPLHYSGDQKNALTPELENYNIQNCQTMDNYRSSLVGLNGIIASIYKIDTNDKEYNSLVKNWQLQKLNNIPNVFAGDIKRKELLEEIEDKFFNKKLSILALYGEENSGKTRLAIDYAYQHNSNYMIKHIIDANNLKQEFHKILNQLGVENINMTEPDLIKRVYKEISSVISYLLIFENAKDYDSIKDYLPRITVNNQHILVTSCYQEWEQKIKITVGKLSKDEAWNLVSKRLPKTTFDQAQELASIKNYRPYELSKAINFINQAGISVSRYLETSGLENVVKDQSVQKSTPKTQIPQGIKTEQKTFSPFQVLLKSIKDRYSNNFARKVFISFEITDIQEVQSWSYKLRNDLKNAGLTVYCSSDSDKSTKINDSDSILIINTPIYKKQVEIANSSLNSEYKLILNEAKNKPNGIFPLQYIGSFGDAVPNELWKFLVRDCQNPLEYEDLMVSQNPLGIIPAIYEIDIDDDKEYRDLLQKWRYQKLNLLPAINFNFSGRKSELSFLEEGFKHHNKQVIFGENGVGKSELAIRFANAHVNKYQIIRWINSGFSIKEEFALFAKELRIDASKIEEAELIEIIHKHLYQTDSYLIIFDNAETHDEIKKYLPAKYKTNQHTLITSCSQNWNNIKYNILKLDVLSKDEAVEYIVKKLPGVEESDACKLAEVLNYLPLALAQAITYLDFNEITISDYIQAYKLTGAEFIDPKTCSRYNYSILNTLKLSIEKISKYSPSAAKMLEACTYLGSENIPIELFEFNSLLKNSIEVNKALVILRNYSLISISNKDDQININKLMQEVVQREIEKDSSHKLSLLKDLGNAFYDLCISLRSYDPEGFKELMLLPHIRVLTNHLSKELGNEELRSIHTSLFEIIKYFI